MEHGGLFKVIGVLRTTEMGELKMMMKTSFMVAALAVAPALADTIDLDFQQIAGGSSATTLSIDGGQLDAGHMVHTITSGARSGESFRTFCVELAELAQTGSSTYDIVSLSEAPAPSARYGQSIADDISAIVANAEALGWIDGRLQADENQSGYLGKMGAIQAAIWEATGGVLNLNSSQTSDELAFYYAVLMNGQTFDDTLRMDGLRAVVAVGEQDMLYVVPLPPAALAGAGLLLAGFGVRAYRRR